MIFKNYYKILGLDTSNVTVDEIKSAYRKEAKKYHPDLNVGKIINEDRIKDINEAYKVLSNAGTKKKYDRTWNSYMRRTNQAFNSKKEKNRIFKMFLGNFEKVEDTNQENIMQRGKNIETQITIGLSEAFYGNEKTIEITDLEKQNRKITIKIPKGIQDGEKIRIIGQGKKGKNGGKNGDLMIEVRIQDEGNFKLKGKDLVTDVFLKPWEAALGTRITVQTIDTETKVYIPRGIQSGEKLRIPGKGYYKNKEDRGDLIAEIKISVPKQLSEEEESLYKKLRDISK